jgi:hypothetical protein
MILAMLMTVYRLQRLSLISLWALSDSTRTCVEQAGGVGCTAHGCAQDPRS